MQMKVKLEFEGKKIELEVDKVEGIKKFIGLMFNKKGKALLFEFSKPTQQPIHSFFCPHFLAVWLNEDNKVLEYRKITPNKLSIKPKKMFTKLLEIPLNEKYSELIKLFLENKKKDLNTASS